MGVLWRRIIHWTITARGFVTTMNDTRMGGSRGEFPETAWSTVISTPDPNSPARRELLSRLCASYWRPVYVSIRATFGKSVEDAKDLTQEFFCRILEEDLLFKYEPERGRFRHFLKSALRHFLANAHRNGKTEKQGGGKQVLSLDLAGLETQRLVHDTTLLGPEEIFDRQWVRDVLFQSVKKLKRALDEEGKSIYFLVYEAYELRPDTEGRPTYEQLAKSLGLSMEDVTNYLHLARARLHDIVVESVSDSVISREELLQEFRDLFSR